MLTPSASPAAPPFWIRHDAKFAISGSIFSQPVADGLLRDRFRHAECGALDAPNYLPTGAVLSRAYPTGFFEDTLISRDRWAEPAPEPDDHCWAPEDDLYTYGDEVAA